MRVPFAPVPTVPRRAPGSADGWGRKGNAHRTSQRASVGQLEGGGRPAVPASSGDEEVEGGGRNFTEPATRQMAIN